MSAFGMRNSSAKAGLHLESAVEQTHRQTDQTAQYFDRLIRRNPVDAALPDAT